MIEQMTTAVPPPIRPGASGRTSAGWPGRLLTLLLALSLAGAGAAIGGRLAWPATSPTTDTAALDAVRAALPGVAAGVTTRSATAFRWDPPLSQPSETVFVPVLGGDSYRYGTVTVTAGPVTDPVAVFAEARQNLITQGWTVDTVEQDDYRRRLAARTDTTILSLEITTTVGADGLLPGRFDPLLTAEVGPRPPTGLAAPMLAGAAIGALLGLLLGLPLTRRFAAPSPRGRVLTSAAVAALLAATPVALAELLVLARYLTGAEPAPFAFDVLAPWHPYTSIYLRLPAQLGALCLIAIVLVAVRRRGGPPARP
ncbi:hypothetical protein AB0F81_21400 [Actinoplanes sp. NPDC024001]|uniref:hypothetical protein n=1 Tax=Actinoplanes sp. NPDC024001 TaxID=3154598 RepID=UPI0033D67759